LSQSNRVLNLDARLHRASRHDIVAAMATFAIGDVHGCYATLSRLLRRIRFNVRRDHLWMVGDLVNRGPRSLDVLRWAAGLGDRLVTVLGNHDLHLLARAEGIVPAKRRDTIDDVLEAPDRDELLHWLLHRPLLHRDGERVLVHAGLFPDWTPAGAAKLAREVERQLRGRGRRQLLRSGASKEPSAWKPRLSGAARARVAIAGFARLRTLTRAGEICADFSGPPEEAPAHCVPWFEAPGRRSLRATVIFGHWAAMGLRLAPGIAALDTGCVWGGKLTALRLDDERVFAEPAVETPRRRSRR
jgi:bis(5'-nucleosyl)-tetraphosphatase (symmetrical)